jgi:hypothetical protein
MQLDPVGGHAGLPVDLIPEPDAFDSQSAETRTANGCPWPMAYPRPPTVHTSRLGVSATALNALRFGRLGFIAILVHLVPSQLERALPPAQTSVGPRSANGRTRPAG